MAIYIESMSGPTACGGIKTFIDTRSWELITTGVTDLFEPVADHEPLINVIQEWLADPDDVPYDGRELARLVLGQVSENKIPIDLRASIQRALQTTEFPCPFP